MLNKRKYNFHHIGSLTGSISSSEKIFELMGFSFYKTIYDPIQEVHLSFGKNDSDIIIELVKPIPNSTVENLLKKNGPGPYHLCYEVGSIQNEEQVLKSIGFICVKKPQKAIAFDNRLVAFFYNPSYGLLELLEKE